MKSRKIKEKNWKSPDSPGRLKEEKHPENFPERRVPRDRTEKLLELLRAARGPEPSPEYLAAFWPRLQEKLGPRPQAIIHPLYYGGLAAAAALVLWVTLLGPDRAGGTPSEFPVYALATASCPVEGERAETNYVSGASRKEANGRSNGVDYVLPRIAARRDGRLEV